MKKQLKVRKTNAGIEQYMHTKVMYTISKALADVNKTDLTVIESLAEVVTYFLYNRHAEHIVQSCEVLSAVKAALAATGYEDAAEALNNHHFQRRLKRNRVEVLDLDINQISDISTACQLKNSCQKYQWDKSVIIEDLTQKHGFDMASARTIAAMTERKIFSLNQYQVSKSLVKQIVLNDTAAVMHAQKQLQTA